MNIFLSAEHLPRLFLKDKERDELKDLVVVHPHWLISAMKAIMELSIDEEEDKDMEKIIILVKQGVIDKDMLKDCWKEFVSKAPNSPDETTQILRLTLLVQAHCLIYPVKIVSAVNGDNPKFIVPCKLPNTTDARVRFKPTTFYFDFCRFLPDEIYHRIICMATQKAMPQLGKSNQYSGTKCIFYGLQNTIWVIELEREKERLKITL